MAIAKPSTGRHLFHIHFNLAIATDFLEGEVLRVEVVGRKTVKKPPLIAEANIVLHELQSLNSTLWTALTSGQFASEYLHQ